MYFIPIFLFLLNECFYVSPHNNILDPPLLEVPFVTVKKRYIQVKKLYSCNQIQEPVVMNNFVGVIGIL